MEFCGDYHMHTTYSDGHSTIEEMVLAGQARGLSEIGISEHGPRNIATGVKDELSLLAVKAEMQRLQGEFPDIKLLTGVEANIMNIQGHLDVSKEILRQLDYLIVGLHPYVLPRDVQGAAWILGNSLSRVAPALRRRIKNNNSKALVEAMHRYDIWAISHPGLKMEIEIQEVARACQVQETAWEINCGHKFPDCNRVAEAFQQGVDFVVNSDAHTFESVGFLEYGSWVLERLNVPPQRVRNAKR